jgi:hypothetical protein
MEHKHGRTVTRSGDIYGEGEPAVGDRPGL